MDDLRWILLGVGVLVIGYVYLMARVERRNKDEQAELNGPRVEPIARMPDLSDLSDESELAEMPDIDDIPDVLMHPRREPSLGNPLQSEPARPKHTPTPTPGRITGDNEFHAEDAQVRAEKSAANIKADSPAAEPPPPDHTPAEQQADQPGQQPSQQPGQKTEQPKGEQKIIALRLMARGGSLPGRSVLDSLAAEGLEFANFGIFHRFSANESDATQRTTVFSVANLLEPGSFDPDTADQWHCPGVAMFLVLPGPRNGVAAFTDMLATARRLAATLQLDILDEGGSTITRQTADHMREEIIDFEHHQRLHKS